MCGQCRSPKKCAKCHRAHHTSLCRSKPGVNPEGINPQRNLAQAPTSVPPEEVKTQCQKPSLASQNCNTQAKQNPKVASNDQASMLTVNQVQSELRSSEESGVSHSLVLANESVLLQTATTVLQNEIHHFTGRLLFDSASQNTFITENTMKTLNLTPDRHINISVAAFQSKRPKLQTFAVVNLDVQCLDMCCRTICALVVPSITCPLYKAQLHPKDKRVLRGLKLADPIADTSSEMIVDVLIGVDHYWDFVDGSIKKFTNGLVAASSALGWMISGVVKDARKTCSGMTASFLIQTNNSALGRQVSRFWDLESMGILPEESQTNEVWDNYVNTVEYHQNRYYVEFPWKKTVDIGSVVPTNQKLAFNRFQGICRRLHKAPELLVKYDAIIKDQFAKGFIELVDSKAYIPGIVHYLAHYPVVKEDSATTKVRIVFDGSAKGPPNGISLNDCLEEGPNMIGDLFNILLRFRIGKVGVCSDIEKAFLMVGLKTKDRDCTRFYWLDDITKDHDAEVVIYRFERVPFGIVSSPFLLMATINYHLEQSQKSEFSNILRSNMYMDNSVLSVDDDSVAVRLYDQAKMLFQEAGMNLREWASNSEFLQRHIPEKDRCAQLCLKVLGLRWDITTDDILLKPLKPTLNEWTKRVVLQVVSQMYDPLGFVTPVTILGKLFFQKLWTLDFGWDAKLSGELIEEWSGIHAELNKLRLFTIPRWLGSTYHDIQELHVFVDASLKAYAAVAYIRFQKPDGSYSVSLVCSKTRLTPLKQAPSLPRLELLAILIGTRLLKRLLDALNTVKISKEYIWSDSQVALSWVASSKVLPQFVDNRVKEIQQHSFRFGYVCSKENPADLPSRGVSWDQLMNSDVWWCGPKWLSVEEKLWPYPHKPITKCDTRNDIGSTAICIAIEQNKFWTSTINCFGTLNRALHVIAYCKRFISKLRRIEIGGPLTTAEIIDARHFCDRMVQSEEFCTEHALLKAKRCTGLVKQLNLFVDEIGLIRCQGRIENASVSKDTKAPKLIPKNHPYTRLIVENLHNKLYHQGVRHTTTALRLEYWLPQARQQIQKVISRCVICRRWEGTSYETPIAPPLPPERVKDKAAFECCGVDYAGPILTKGSKSWICLITCAVTRAVHLELVPDMTTHQFLLALRRFVALRGVPSQIYSDNAKTFKLAKGTLEYLWSTLLSNEEVLTYVAKNGIRWKFNVERAPWWGGFFERMVGLAKRSLRKGVGKAQLSFIELETQLHEIEAILNSRPLTFVFHEIQDGQPLTPNDLLGMRRPVGFPNSEYLEHDPSYGKEESSESLSRRVLHTQKVLNSFWKVWKQEYLTQLREHHLRCTNKGKTDYHSPVLGDVVLIKEDLPRGQWKTGIISKIHQSKDGYIRAADVKTRGNILSRPIQLLFPIEVRAKMVELSSDSELADTDGTSMTEKVVQGCDKPRKRVQRAAAKNAVIKMRNFASFSAVEDDGIT